MKTPESLVKECTQAMDLILETANKRKSKHTDVFEKMTEEEAGAFWDLRKKIYELWPSIVENARNRIKEKRLKASKTGD